MAAKKGGCAGAASHRKAQSKYVAKNKSKHAAAVKRSYQKSKGKILAQKKRARKSGAAKGGSPGRPRKC
jgi:hypothetical protein